MRIYWQQCRMMPIGRQPSPRRSMRSPGSASLGLHASDSPLWYRGNVGCSAPIEVDRLAAALESIGARRVVIGHTPTLTHQVLSRLGGRVIEIDTGMLNAYYGGTGNALVIDADQLRVVAETTAAGEAVVPHPRRVGLRSPELSALRLEEILRSGDIEPKATDDMLGEVVNVSHDGTTVSALFVPNPRRRGLVPELAAYRLDRFLELGMVPVTVARDFNGKSGVLQFLPDQRVNEKQRHEASGGGGAWCPLPEQWNAMYTFDALLHNPRARSGAHALQPRQLSVVPNRPTLGRLARRAASRITCSRFR